MANKTTDVKIDTEKLEKDNEALSTASDKIKSELLNGDDTDTKGLTANTHFHLEYEYSQNLISTLKGQIDPLATSIEKYNNTVAKIDTNAAAKCQEIQDRDEMIMRREYQKNMEAFDFWEKIAIQLEEDICADREQSEKMISSGMLDSDLEEIYEERRLMQIEFLEKNKKDRTAIEERRNALKEEYEKAEEEEIDD